MRDHVLDLDPRIWIKGTSNYCEFLFSLRMGHRPEFIKYIATQETRRSASDYITEELEASGCLSSFSVSPSDENEINLDLNQPTNGKQSHEDGAELSN